MFPDFGKQNLDFADAQDPSTSCLRRQALGMTKQINFIHFITRVLLHEYFIGRGVRTRTGDLTHPMRAFYQLNYTPPSS